MSGDVEYQRLMELGFAFCASQLLFAGVSLDVFSRLEQAGEMTADELQASLGVSRRGMANMADAMVAVGLLQRNGGHYANTPAAARYLVRERPEYIGDFLAFVAARLYPVWRYLPEAVHSGVPQNEARVEADYYGNLGGDHERHQCFLKGMAGFSAWPADRIAACVPWARYRSFVDVGGAAGELAHRLVAKHPHLDGRVFDLPSVQSFFDAGATAGRGKVQFVAGDFFVDPLPRADVMVMGHILHNWSMEQKHQLVSSAYRAIHDGGALVVYEWLLDDERSRPLPLAMSLNMLLVTREGTGMTTRTCTELMHEAGFGAVEVTGSAGPYTIVCAYKA